MNQPLSIAAASLALAMAMATGCQRPGPPPAKKATTTQKAPAKVLVGIAREIRLQETVELPATVQSDETALLMARVEAYVAEVLVDIGDEVTEGQVLIRLDAPELAHRVAEQRAMLGQLVAGDQVLEAEAEAAKAQLGVVRAELNLKSSERERLARLVSTGAIGRQRLEEAESSVQSAGAMLTRYENAVQVAQARLIQGESEKAVAESRLQVAQAQADYLEIKAPFTGIVAKRNVDLGNLVRPGSGAKPLLVIEKVDRLRAIVYATADVAAQLTTGDSVAFVSDDASVQAVLSRTAGSYDTKTRMMRAEIDLDNSIDPATNQRPMRPGGYGLATIVLREETLPVVPESAILRVNGTTSVVVIHNKTCQIVPVEIAIESDGQVGIASGINSGDQVVFEDPKAITPGQVLERNQMNLVP